LRIGGLLFNFTRSRIRRPFSRAGIECDFVGLTVPSIHLKIAPKGEPPLFLELGEGRFLIGRGEDCEVLIDHADISRRHALLLVDPDGVFVEDLGSSNGTFIDGRLARERTVFRPGDTLVLGADVIRIEFADREDETAGVGRFRGRTGGVERDLSQSNYHFRKEIARGGMGTVLEAEDLNTGRVVAIKKMLQGSAATAEGQFRFQQEARIMGFLEHANIVPMHELGVNSKGVPYYTMKRVQGRTLQQVLNAIREGDQKVIADFPLERLLRVFQKVCDGIAFAHSRGVVHRDLKPENVLIGDYGEVMVMDWGLAKVLPDSPLTHTVIGRMPDIFDVGPLTEADSAEVTRSGRFRTRDGQVLGTPNYMPPEQAEGRLEEVDRRSDIFSLGGILYAILTLRPPVTGDTVEEVLENMRSGYIPPPVIYNKIKAARLPGMGSRDRKQILLRHCPGREIPEPLSRVAMRAMARRPEERYPSVRDLQLEVEDWLAGRVTRAEEAGWGRQLRLFLARNTTAVAAVLVVVLFTGLSLAFSYREEQIARAKHAQFQGSIGLLEGKVRELIAAGEFRAAESWLQPLVALMSSEPRYWIEKGYVHLMLNDHEQAIAAFRRAEREGADPARTGEAIALCRDLRDHTRKGELSPEGARLLIDHLRARRRFSEARWLAENAEVQLALTPEAVEAMRGMIAERGAPEAVRDRLGIDAEGRLALDLSGLEITDLDWLAQLPLESVNLAGTGISDLRRLRGMPLIRLDLSGAGVTDLDPLRGMSLLDLRLDGTPVTDLGVLSGNTTLTNLSLADTGVESLEPLAETRRLRSLRLSGNRRVSDLSPIANNNLHTLDITGCAAITNIAALAGMELAVLRMSRSGVSDLWPLKDARLQHVWMSQIPAADFNVLRGKRLRTGWFNETALNDLSVFADMALSELHLAKVPARDFSVLRSLPLDRLTLSGTLIESLEPLSSQRELKYLDVSYTRVRELAPLTRVRITELLLHGCNGIEDWKNLRLIRGLTRVSFPAGAVSNRVRAGLSSVRVIAALDEEQTAAVEDLACWRDPASQRRFWTHGVEVARK